MQLTKEVLQSDRKVFEDQVKNGQQTIAYIDGLLAYMDKPEPVSVPLMPEFLVIEEPAVAVEGEAIDG